jgi:PGF-pre-PGF domain-containing protein/predicted secreted protein with PEFG-CTERM motif
MVGFNVRPPGGAFVEGSQILDIQIPEEDQDKAGFYHLSITPEIDLVNFNITAWRLEKNPEGVPTPSGIAERYFLLNYGFTNIHDLSELQLEDPFANTTIRFEVDSSWLNENRATAEAVSLQRFSLSEWVWEKVPTRIISDERGKIQFESSVDTLSYLAVTVGPTEGTITVDDTDLSVSYSIEGGKLVRVFGDGKGKSLVMPIQATQDGLLTLILPRSVVDAKKGDMDVPFIVLQDGKEMDYYEQTNSTHRTLTIHFTKGTEEIEIIGTHVIPEFPLGVLIILAVLITLAAIFSKSKIITYR